MGGKIMINIMNILSKIGTAKTIALSVATAGVIGGTVAGVAIHNDKTEMHIKNNTSISAGVSSESVSKKDDVYVVSIESSRNVTALSIYEQLIATGDLISDTDINVSEGTDTDTVDLHNIDSDDTVSVTYEDGTDSKDFVSSGEYDDKLVISDSETTNRIISIKIVIKRNAKTGTTQTETSVTSTETTLVTGVSTSVTSVTSVTGVVTSVITDTRGNEVQVIEVNEDQNTDDDNNVDINNSNEDNNDSNVDSNTDSNNNSASGSITNPVSKPQPTTKAPDPIPEPEPIPEPTPEPIPEPDPEPITEDDNSGYPDWCVSVSDRENFDYAISMGCDVSQAGAYCASVDAFGKDRVVIGIPEGGEEIGMYWAVWTLVDEENGIWETNYR